MMAGFGSEKGRGFLKCTSSLPFKSRGAGVGVGVGLGLWVAILATERVLRTAFAMSEC